MHLTLLVKLVMPHLWSLGLFLEFGSFFHSGLQNTHLQENSALETYFFWNFRHIPTTLDRLEFAPQFVQNCPLAPGLAVMGVLVFSSLSWNSSSSNNLRASSCGTLGYRAATSKDISLWFSGIFKFLALYSAFTL